MRKGKLILNTYEDLEHHLRNCIHWDFTEVGQYDLIGITGLLSALLDNLGNNVHDSVLEDIKDVLSEKNIEFLKRLLNAKQKDE